MHGRVAPGVYLIWSEVNINSKSQNNYESWKSLFISQSTSKKKRNLMTLAKILIISACKMWRYIKRSENKFMNKAVNSISNMHYAIVISMTYCVIPYKAIQIGILSITDAFKQDNSSHSLRNQWKASRYLKCMKEDRHRENQWFSKASK